MTRLEECRNNSRVYIIAEMSANHGGSLEQALRIVRAAATAGADCVKIQTFTADTITLDCRTDLFTIEGGPWAGRNLHDLYHEAHTPWEWHPAIKAECESLGMDFLSTPFDFTSVEFLEDLGVGAYKIASPELVDLPLIRCVAAKGKPMFVSTGMASEDEIDQAVKVIRSEGLEDFYLFQTCSQYPADYENMNLSLLVYMRERFQCATGLSDHSFGSLGPVIAVSLGAKVIEKHLCLTRADEGPDSLFSMEPEEFRVMVHDVRATESILGSSVFGPTKDEVRGLRNRRSLFAVASIGKGEAFTPDNVRSIRPGHGLPPKEYEYVLQCHAKTDIPFGTPLDWSMIEGAAE